MLKHRVYTALVIGPLAVAALFWLSLQNLAIALGAVVAVSAWEWSKLTGFTETVSRGLFVCAITILYALLIWTQVDALPIASWELQGVNGVLVSMGVAWWILATLLVLTFPSSSRLWKHSAPLKTLAGLLTLLPFAIALLGLRGVELGAQLVLHLLLMVWAADTGAYFSGKRFGKHKLMPRVSPGKTIEGLLGGLFAASLVAVLGAWLLGVAPAKWPLFVLCGLAAVCASVIGDLAESMFKRQAGIKDSGRILPGHGGILDRIDSLTAAFPVYVLTFWHWVL